jgi:hypothetical protein
MTYALLAIVVAFSWFMGWQSHKFLAHKSDLLEMTQEFERIALGGSISEN